MKVIFTQSMYYHQRGEAARANIFIEIVGFAHSDGQVDQHLVQPHPYIIIFGVGDMLCVGEGDQGWEMSMLHVGSEESVSGYRNEVRVGCDARRERVW